jgi:Zn finger protein HypA/HybF involved in hydrogenase expression
MSTGHVTVADILMMRLYMADHKAYCDCLKCIQAKSLKPKRVLPSWVRAQYEEKHAQEEEFMLKQGKFLFTCPSCKHKTYVKIGPVVTCGACGHKVS